ncbi:hypothetical protein FISHEDRAFT_70197 [Fistulina hepatica ATCC 64428]|uniref:Concanavalin A-like lectin/glucanase n=1 Tax=Fistulina hepatica ATCC 64428 TaxID=1128425 RepID=A0A0D7AKY1_9AGAR|nr:hypothetical protein FISHEDRAFT_70197 [Fistulina hepatica ATCC 64428]
MSAPSMPYALCFFLVSLFFAAQTLASLTVLNAGGATNDTNFGATADGLLQWQATGLLYDGCDDDKITIDTCYSFELTDDPSEEVDTDLGEQFVMFVTEQAAAGDVFVFTWKYYLSSTVGTSTDTVALAQIYSRSGSPSIIGGLSAAHGLIRSRTASATARPVHVHRLNGKINNRVTFGNSGSLKYTITNAETNAQLLQYSATGNMGSEASCV